MRGCQSPVWIWLVNYLHLHLHLHKRWCTCGHGSFHLLPRRFTEGTPEMLARRTPADSYLGECHSLDFNLGETAGQGAVADGLAEHVRISDCLCQGGRRCLGDDVNLGSGNVTVARICTRIRAGLGNRVGFDHRRDAGRNELTPSQERSNLNTRSAAVHMAIQLSYHVEASTWQRCCVPLPGDPACTVVQ